MTYNPGAKKKKRYCKGCFADVTGKMFCSCGEFTLAECDTLSEKEMKNMKI